MRSRAAVIAAVALAACARPSATPAIVVVVAPAKPAPAIEAPAALAPVRRTLDVNRDTGCAITAGHRVACWGSGPIVAAFAKQPWTRTATVIPDLADAVQLALGDHDACIVRARGEVACLGSNAGGELGVADPKATRAVVPGIPPAKRVAVGEAAACSASADGTVWCWGDLDDQDGVHFQSPFPLSVFTDAVDVAVGFRGACVLRATGRVTCFRVHPSLAPGDLFERSEEHVVEVVDRNGTICVRTAAGMLRCFAPGETGQLEPASGVQQIAVNGIEHCVRAWDATVACTGNGDIVVPRGRYNAALQTNPHVTGAVELAMGQSDACVRHRDDTIACWGSGRDRGILGDGEQPTHLEPHVVDLPPVAEFTSTSCVRLVDGRLRCWGGPDDDDKLPWDPLKDLSRVHPNDPIVEMPSVCGRTRGGFVECWRDGKPDLVKVLAPLSHVVALEERLDGGCTIDRIGKVACWDPAWSGGPDTITLVRAPLDDRAVQLVGNNQFTCARLANGRVECWGDVAEIVDLGAQPTRPGSQIYAFRGIDDATELAFDHQICMLRRAHPATCFGGDNRPVDQPAIELAHATHLSINRTACWIDTSDHVQCLGENLAPGEPPMAGPRTIDVHGKPVAIAAGFAGACVLRADHKVACFGEWALGELGDGASAYSETPVVVRGWPPP